MRLLISDFVEQVILSLEDVSDEQKQKLIAVLVGQASLEDIKQSMREVSRG